MRVVARINGLVDVPFLIDTGATDVLLPQWAADELGLRARVRDISCTDRVKL